MREVERHAAALRVAEAAGLHGKLLTLHERSGQIADAYADHTGTHDAAELAGRLRFVSGLQAILRETEGDRRKAEANPWGEGATTLEWTLSSPPPFHQFSTLPVIK